MKKSYKIILGILGVIILLCMLMSINPVAEQVSKVINKPVSVIKFWAMTILWFALGAFLISVGTGALVVPWVGIVLIAAGLSLITYAAWPLFNSNSAE